VSSDAWLAIAVTALALSGVLSCLAQSLRELSRTVLEEIATIRKRPRASARVAKIIDDVDGHASSIALPRVVCNLGFVVAVVMFIVQMREMQQPTWVEVGGGVLAASILLWIFGTLLPTSVARHAGEAVVYAWSPLIRLGHFATAPFRPVMRLIDEVVKRLAGKAGQDEGEAITQEILSVVEDAREDGAFDEAERDMIEAVVKFRDRTVAQVMTPRTEIEAMPLSDDLSKVTAIIRTIGHSRIPVFEGDLDHVVGIFYVKDLMKWLAGEGSRTGKPFELRSLLRPALFVPETKTIRELLPELLAKRVHIAMVADEYGGTSGLVTIEDIVEEVFGDIQDEYEQHDDSSIDVKVDEGARSAEIDARAAIIDANHALRTLGASLPESEDYETVGGLVTVSLGRIPVAGETVTLSTGVITVLAAEPTRVTRVRFDAVAGEPALAEMRSGGK
jgi:putative hemolysin